MPISEFTAPENVEVHGPLQPGFDDILTPAALAFVADLARRFEPHRRELLAARAVRQQALDGGQRPDFLPETAQIRRQEWRVAPVPEVLQRRHLEITGPVERKMMINALNSGADVFMADFEDANSPTWHNTIQGHINLRDAIERTITYEGPDGRAYELDEETATLFVRPRGWHLTDKHLRVDGEPISGSLLDFGLYIFHCGPRLVDRGLAPFFYLPKLENHLEARLWNDVFLRAQEALGLPRGTIKATVLIENILAVFEMDEILYELRDHSAGLNAGRWDYIFSVIRKFRRQPASLLPDRAQVTMTVGFMRAYTELLVRTCHRRGAHAIGGMAAFIPSRKDPEVTRIALARVREDKERETGDGFDGTWLAHPDLVPVVREVFDERLGERSHQLSRLREEVRVGPGELLDFRIPAGRITEQGLGGNITVAVVYLESWLRGAGAVAIMNLMEDTATAEISRSQLWQWVHHPDAKLDDGRPITPALYREAAARALADIERTVGEGNYAAGRYGEAARLLDELVLADEFPEFLTLKAYDLLP
jgi:malate synthase